MHGGSCLLIPLTLPLHLACIIYSSSRIIEGKPRVQREKDHPCQVVVVVLLIDPPMAGIDPGEGEREECKKDGSMTRSFTG